MVQQKKKNLFLKNANPHLSLQWTVVLTSKGHHDHRSPWQIYHSEQFRNTEQITKNRSRYELSQCFQKPVPTDLLHKGLSWIFNLWKIQYLQSTVCRDMPVMLSFLSWVWIHRCSLLSLPSPHILDTKLRTFYKIDLFLESICFCTLTFHMFSPDDFLVILKNYGNLVINLIFNYF